MSDFGLFENDEAAAQEPRLAAKTATRQLEAAINVVRSKFGKFLLGATGIDEFGDRWHYSKNDIRSAVEPHVFPNTGTMRRIQNAMKADWKVAHPYKLALGEGETPTGGPLEGPMDLGYGDLPERLRPRSEDDLDMPMVDKLHQQYHDDPFRKHGPELDPAAGHAGFGEFSSFGPDQWDYDAINRMTDSRQEHERGRTSNRRYAEDRDAPLQDIDETYHPSGGNLIPEGNFEGYKDSVDQDGPAKVQRDFTPGGDSGRQARRRQAGEHSFPHDDPDRWDEMSHNVVRNPYSGEPRGMLVEGDPHDPEHHWEVPDGQGGFNAPPQGVGSGGKHSVDPIRSRQDQLYFGDTPPDTNPYTGGPVDWGHPDYPGESGDWEGDPEDGHFREAARLVADIYTDFARSNGLRVASLNTLNHYASTGIHDADYRLLQALIVRQAECDEECDDEEEEATEASESDESESGDDEGEDYDFGGEDDAEGEEEAPEDDEADEDGDTEESDEDYDFGGEDEGEEDQGGGEQYTVPEQAPELPPEMMAEIPQDDASGSAPVPPEVVDSLLGLPEGTIEQLLLEEVEQGSQGGDPGMSGPPMPPEGGGEDFFGGGGDDAEQEPPRVARRRQATPKGLKDKTNEYGRKKAPAKTKTPGGYKREPVDSADAMDMDRERQIEEGNRKRDAARRRQAGAHDIHDGGPDMVNPYTGLSGGPHNVNPGWNDGDPTTRSWQQLAGRSGRYRAEAARSFWAAEGDPEQESEGGGGEQAAPAQDPAAAMGGGDPAAMGMQQPMMPPPGSQAVTPPQPPAPLENQPAEDALLDTANQAIMQMIDQETAEYQQIIDPLSQALQAIQFAQQVEQSEHPMDVTPPQGTVDVSPAAAPGGAGNPMQQQAMRRWAGEHSAPPGAGEDNVHGGFTDWPGSIYQDRIWNMMDEHGIEPDGRNYRYHQDRHGYEASRRRQAKVEFGIRNAAALIASRYRLSATGHQMLLNAALGRRGYEHVVEALKLVPPEVRKAAALHMSHLFSAGNQRFNRDVFMKTVMASNPRDRAGDAWRDGRDRGIAEHGRQDMDDRYEEAPLSRREQEIRMTRELFPDRPQQVPRRLRDLGRSSSRGRLPFDRPRLAGETWTNTALMDEFEFPDPGQPETRDKHEVNNLPNLPGGHIGASQKAVDRFQRWQKNQQKKGLPTTQGESAVHNFLQTSKPYKKRVGPDAANMIHEELGLEPDAVKTPKAKPVKAVNPTLKGKGGKTPAAPKAKAPAPKAAPKTASFFTRKVPGWRWDDHLSGYLSKEARAFTCSCGQKIASPSYKTCSCGKVWNVYAIGDSHHLASDTAEVYIAREIPVRPGVIMANKKMAAGEPPSIHDHMYEIDRTGIPRWLKGKYYRQRAKALLALGEHERFADYLADHAYNKYTDIHMTEGHDENEAENWWARSGQADDYLKAVQEHFGGGHTANRKMAALSDEDRNRMSDEMMQTIDSYRGEPFTGAGIPNDVHSFGQLHDYFDANVGWSDEIDGLGTDDWADLQNHVNDRMQERHLKKMYPEGLDPDAKQDPFDPRLIGAAKKSHRELLAEIDKLAGDGMSYEDAMAHIDQALAEGPQNDDPYASSHVECRYCDGPASHGVEDMSGRKFPVCEGCLESELGGRGGIESWPIDSHRTSVRRAQKSHAELVAMIDKLADWTKYDSPDPTRDPKVKPPSTKIKSQPGDWTNRDFIGPTKGQWREPDPTELPRKTRKKK